MKKMSENEWIALGNQTKQAREELFKLISKASNNLPNELNKPISNAIENIDKFRMKAENRMFENGESENLDIFYGKMQSTKQDEKGEFQ